MAPTNRNVNKQDDQNVNRTMPARSGPGTSRRGFASMDESRQRDIASQGGKAAHERGTAHEFTSEEAREAGRKGGEAVSQNRSHMAEIGRRGGEARGQNSRAAMAARAAAANDDDIGNRVTPQRASSRDDDADTQRPSYRGSGRQEDDVERASASLHGSGRGDNDDVEGRGRASLRNDGDDVERGNPKNR